MYVVYSLIASSISTVATASGGARDTTALNVYVFDVLPWLTFLVVLAVVDSVHATPFPIFSHVSI